MAFTATVEAVGKGSYCSGFLAGQVAFAATGVAPNDLQVTFVVSLVTPTLCPALQISTIMLPCVHEFAVNRCKGLDICPLLRYSAFKCALMHSLR